MQEKSSIPTNADNESKGETIDQLAHRHLMNQNHTTSDDEIRNATLDLSERNFDVPGEELFEVDNTTVVPPINDEPNPAKSDEDEATDNGNDTDEVPNPYTILGS